MYNSCHYIYIMLTRHIFQHLYDVMSPPSICLDHIIAHDTYHFFHGLPLKLAPTCFIKQCGTSRTQELEYTWWSKLQITLNVQHKVRVTCKLLSVSKLNHSFFVKILVNRFASHIFDTFNMIWRQGKPKRRLKNDQTWFYLFIYLLFLKNALFGHIFF